MRTIIYCIRIHKCIGRFCVGGRISFPFGVHRRCCCCCCCCDQCHCGVILYLKYITLYSTIRSCKGTGRGALHAQNKKKKKVKIDKLIIIFVPRFCRLNTKKYHCNRTYTLHSLYTVYCSTLCSKINEFRYRYT